MVLKVNIRHQVHNIECYPMYDNQNMVLLKKYKYYSQLEYVDIVLKNNLMLLAVRVRDG